MDSYSSTKHPIDAVLRKSKSTFMPNFTRKWSQHDHGVSDCKKTITMDGCWKIFRTKCAFDLDEVETVEFDNIVTGCRVTPSVNSYFCNEHRNYELSFNAGDSVVKLNPNSISLGRLSKKFFYKKL